MSPESERYAAVYLSPDAFAQRTSEATIAEQISEVFVRYEERFPPCGEADDDRVGGWNLIYTLLESRGLEISEECVHLIDCLPSLTRDPDYVEDALKATGDDPADSARYGLKTRLAPGRKPLEQRIVERVGKVEDPTSRAIRIQQAIAAERKKEAPIRPRRILPGSRRGW